MRQTSQPKRALTRSNTTTTQQIELKNQAKSAKRKQKARQNKSMYTAAITTCNYCGCTATTKPPQNENTTNSTNWQSTNRRNEMHLLPAEIFCAFAETAAAHHEVVFTDQTVCVVAASAAHIQSTQQHGQVKNETTQRPRQNSKIAYHMRAPLPFLVPWACHVAWTTRRKQTKR